MTLIREPCVEKACSRLSARNISYLSAMAMARSDRLPFRLSMPIWERAIGVGCVRGMGVGLGVEVDARV